MQSRRSFVRAMAATPALIAGHAFAQPAGAATPLAADGAGVVLQPGVHTVPANMTVRADVLVLPGATIEVAAGRTMTLLGDFIAPVAHVFTGAGRIDMNASRAPAAHPEWWGAAPGDGRADCLPALMACVAAHPTTELLANDYFISDSWRVDRSHRRIWGAGSYWHGPNQGTRVIVRGGDRDVMIVGTATKPAGIPAFVQNVDLRWLELARTEPVTAVAGDPGSAPSGLRARYVLNCQFEGLTAPEHAIGFSITGAVHSFFRECLTLRTYPGSVDFYWGFHFDGRPDIGLAGGNASLYVTDCGVNTAGAPRLAQVVGAFLQGAFSDTFLTRFETAEMAQGILVDGMAAGMTADRREAGQINLHIVQPIVDQCSVSGIELTGLSEHALVDIVDPYVAAGTGTSAAFSMHGCRGLTTISGGQLIGAYDARRGGTAAGILATASEGLDVRGTKLLGFRRPVAVDRCVDMQFDIAINNQGYRTDQAAVRLRDVTRVGLRCRAKGTSGVFPQGVSLEGGHEALSIDATGIDPSALANGGARVVADGRPVAAGPFGTNMLIDAGG